MRVTILGSGTCAPHARRLSAGYWVEAGPFRMRFECGPGTVHASADRARYPHIDWTTQTHQLLTHEHVDHIADLPALLFAFKYGWQPKPRGPLTIFGPLGIGDRIRALDDALSAGLLDQRMPVPIVEVSSEDTIPLGRDPHKVTLRALHVPHTPTSLAWRLDSPTGSVGFTGDTSPNVDRLGPFMRDVDLLIAECSHPEATGTAHMTIADIADLADSAVPRKLLTVHHYFDPTAPDIAARTTAEWPAHVSVAEDGMVIDVAALRAT